jgi:hypothetical protein
MDLKAFAVTEHDENTGAVIFAKHDIVARRIGADEYADGELSYVSCRRAPWADAYADKAVPARVMIAHGWHFECSECGSRIDEDYLFDNRLPVDCVVGTQHSHVFCCSKCARRWYSMKRRRKAEELRAIEAFKAVVRKRFPDAEFCDEEDQFRGHHAYVTPERGGWNWQQVIVAFRFPGMKHGPAHFRMDSRHKPGPHLASYTCCNGDKEAFEAYAFATKQAVAA